MRLAKSIFFKTVANLKTKVVFHQTFISIISVTLVFEDKSMSMNIIFWSIPTKRMLATLDADTTDLKTKVITQRKIKARLAGGGKGQVGRLERIRMMFSFRSIIIFQIMVRIKKKLHKTASTLRFNSKIPLILWYMEGSGKNTSPPWVFVGLRYFEKWYHQ